MNGFPSVLQGHRKQQTPLRSNRLGRVHRVNKALSQASWTSAWKPWSIARKVFVMVGVNIADCAGGRDLVTLWLHGEARFSNGVDCQ